MAQLKAPVIEDDKPLIAASMFGNTTAAVDRARSRLEEHGDEVLVFHGGPFDEPDQVGEALRRMPSVAGFFGASSIERLPTERAITEQVESFKALPVAE